MSNRRTHNTGDFFHIHTGLNAHSSRPYLQYLFACLLIRRSDIQDAVESPRTHKGGILLIRSGQWAPRCRKKGNSYNDIWPIGGGHNRDTQELLNAIHFVQETCKHPLMGGGTRISITRCSRGRQCVNLVLNNDKGLGHAERLGDMKLTKKMMDGAAARAFLKISRTPLSDSPTNLFKSCKAISGQHEEPKRT